ncbi:GNAT family N-acetyltransferase [Nocardioides mesophilus]|uniref:GNAT family N-acetyltransferase n=1 Tax=Nocardioides mesophilus TaxID=433659 RepID=A0A7G9R794_9ACTN|nr:GNAT family N-acetyltransferase [Nocardioides mesophilus]QNN51469.1 GNAT family N-acetyltransferase [Nocardioides mesophilus]
MLWRVRTTLADRPGALAHLARRCGERTVNILGLQIFPGVDGVTDELVLRAPEGWGVTELTALVEAAGGTRISVGRCSEHALADGPTRHLSAIRAVLHGTSPVGAVLADLLDADPVGATGPQERLEVDVAGQRVEVRRTEPFTGTEHARAQAFAALVGDLVERGLTDPVPEPAAPPGRPVGRSAHGVLLREGTLDDVPALLAMHARCSADTVYRQYAAPLARLDARLARRILRGGEGSLVAEASGAVVGLAALAAAVGDTCELSLLVEDGWQRRGVGTRLLAAATRLAASAGIAEVLLRGPAENPAAIAMVFGSGLRARVRLHDEELQVTVSTRGLAAASPAATGAPGTVGAASAASARLVRGGRRG